MATKKAAAVKPAHKARVETEVVTITAEQFLAGIKKFSAGFESIARIEGLLSAQQSPIRITEEHYATPPPGKVSSDTAPVSVLIDDVHSRTSGLRGRIESLRDSLVHGINPNNATQGIGGCSAGTPSQGPSKDALNYSFGNLVACEEMIGEIERYLLNR